jgi:hypothetical protein
VRRKQVRSVDRDQVAVFARVDRHARDDTDAEAEPHVGFDYIRVTCSERDTRRQAGARENLLQR